MEIKKDKEGNVTDFGFIRKQIKNRDDLKIALGKMFKDKKNEGKGPSMLIIKVKKGSSENLGRPTTTPIQNKDFFMKSLQK